MKWVTRRGMHVDRTACAWLIQKHIDPEAEFQFVAADSDPGLVEGRTFDIRGGDYTHTDGKCSFEVMLEKHGLTEDSSLCELGRIVREADVPSRGRRSKEAGGLDAIMRGFQLGVVDDYAKLRLTGPVYDALYAYCREKAADKKGSQAIPRPKLRYGRRFIDHVLEEASDADEGHTGKVP